MTGRSRIAFIVLALVAAGAVVVALTGPTRPERWILVGFSDNAVAQSLATPEQAAALVARAGADIDRVQFDWRAAEPRPGDLRLDAYDAIYKALRARGIRPLFVFAYAPAWAAEAPCARSPGGCHAPPAADHVADAARTAARLARRYPEMAGIEIWNEPNTSYFWAPAPSVSAYATLLKACYRAVKAVDKDMTVVGGAVVNTPAKGSLRLGEFVRGILRHDAARAMDVLSIHAYPDPGDVGGASAMRAVFEARQVLEDADAVELPIWITETGMTTTGPGAVSEPEQSAALSNLLHRMRAVEPVEMVAFHTLIDPLRGPESRESGFGVVASDLRPKPAYHVLAAAIADRDGARPPRRAR